MRLITLNPTLATWLILTATFIGIVQPASATQTKVDHSSNQLIILLYHHIANDTPAATSTKPEQFQQHLKYLHDQNFQVVDLVSALNRLYSGQPLPTKAVAITFDDGYDSIFTQAWPLLKRYNYPFTVMVTTDPIDKKFSSMMTWQQLNQLQSAGVTIANHTLTHPHLIGVSEQKLQQEYMAAQQRLTEKLKQKPPSLFAYPYGEYTREQAHWFAQRKIFALAQHSGPVSIASNPQALPRFSFSGLYANMEQFELKLGTVALPVINQIDYQPYYEKSQRVFNLTFDASEIQASAINCFFQGQPVASISASTPKNESLKTHSQSITIQLNQSPPPGRSRINCTAPRSNQKGYYWHSLPIFTQPESKQWPD